MKEYFKYYNLTKRKIQIDEIEVNRLELLETVGNEYTFIVNASIHGKYENNEAINERLFSKFTLTKNDSTFFISKIEKILSGNRLEQ